VQRNRVTYEGITQHSDHSSSYALLTLSSNAFSAIRIMRATLCKCVCSRSQRRNAWNRSLSDSIATWVCFRNVSVWNESIRSHSSFPRSMYTGLVFTRLDGRAGLTESRPFGLPWLFGLPRLFGLRMSIHESRRTSECLIYASRPDVRGTYAATNCLRPPGPEKNTVRAELLGGMSPCHISLNMTARHPRARARTCW
jgi:hypothetical protein